MKPVSGMFPFGEGSCPKKWTTFAKDKTLCFRDSAFQPFRKIPIKKISGPNPITMVANSQVNPHENSDSLLIATDGNVAKINPTLPPAGIPELGNYWQKAEFNIFGADGGAPLMFKPGTLLTPEVMPKFGADPHQCKEDTSGEVATTLAANNLTLVPDSCVATGYFPALEFKESM